MCAAWLFFCCCGCRLQGGSDRSASLGSWSLHIWLCRQVACFPRHQPQSVFPLLFNHRVTSASVCQAELVKSVSHVWHVCVKCEICAFCPCDIFCVSHVTFLCDTSALNVWDVCVLLVDVQALTKYQMLFRHLFYCKHVERQLCKWVSLLSLFTQLSSWWNSWLSAELCSTADALNTA